MRNRLLSHRGCWKHGYAKNSKAAFQRSFANGYGVETDIRDQNGSLVISHDVPTVPCLSFQEFLEMAVPDTLSEARVLALNIKSDGLTNLLQRCVSEYPSLNCFVFDMSVPDMRSYLDSNVSVFTRLSDVEPVPVWLDVSEGVWLDAFNGEWYSIDVVRDLLSSGKRVCIVSPELHLRPHEVFWARLRSVWSDPKLMLCTDYPDEAFSYFSGAG